MQSAPRKQRETGVFKEIWKAHNQLLDFCREIAPLPSSSQGVYVDRKANGTAFRVVPQISTAADSGLKRVTIAAISGDSLECTDADGDTVLVEKPPVFKGYPTTRTISISGTTVSESIYPPYSVGDKLIVARIAATQESEEAWMDVTVGRCWRIDMRSVAVCINGDDSWLMLVPGSPPFKPV